MSKGSALYFLSRWMCIGVKDICNTITFSTADPTFLISSVMFVEVHISGCNIYTSISVITHVCFSILTLMSQFDSTVLCHMNHDAYSKHGGLLINC